MEVGCYIFLNQHKISFFEYVAHPKRDYKRTYTHNERHHILTFMAIAQTKYFDVENNL